MIAYLRGTVLEKSVGGAGAMPIAVIDVNGVGYRVNLSTLSFLKLSPEGEPARLRIQTIMREDSLELFGFLTRPEEELFLKLTSVSHVGPRLALAVLSGMEVEELNQALRKEEVARLTKIHGVGKKTAERLVLELKDKVGVATASGEPAPRPRAGVLADVVSTLVNHGFKEAQSERAAAAAQEALGAGAAEVQFEALFRESLKRLRPGA